MALLAKVDVSLGEMTAATDSGESPPLLTAVLREALHGGKGKKYTHVLYADIESVGGESITKRWLFRSPKIRYVGGAQLSYLLLDLRTAGITAAGTRSLLGHTRVALGGWFTKPVEPISSVDFNPPLPETDEQSAENAAERSDEAPEQEGEATEASESKKEASPAA